MLKLKTKIGFSTALKTIFVGIYVYFFIYTVYNPQGMSPLKLISVLAILLSAMLLIIFSFKYIRKDHGKLPFIPKVLYFALILWSFSMIIRSISGNMQDMMTLFGRYNTAWPWLAPMAMIFGLRVQTLLKVYSFSISVFVAGFVLLAYFIAIGSQYAMWTTHEMFIPVFLLLLLYPIQTRKHRIITGLAILGYLAVSYYLDRRAGFIHTFMTLMFFLLIYTMDSKANIVKKFFLLFFSIIVLSYASYLVIENMQALQDNPDITTDTRSFIVEEMSEDLTDKDIKFGKGALGFYYSPFFYQMSLSDEGGGDGAYRYNAEIGYLHMILKGGVILVALYVLLLLPAVFLGFFKSKNAITKGGALYIFGFMILWLVTYTPIFTPMYLMLWMSAGACYSKRIRKMSNEDLRLMYQQITQR
jgi:cell division protein FtsL